ncbi:MAG: XrtV sorting system accessory protein [bacterium]
MTSFFDICSVILFIGAASLFFHRLQFEDPPLWPYATIMIACALGNWAGENISTMTGTVLLISGGFLIVHLASQPFVAGDDHSD